MILFLIIIMFLCIVAENSERMPQVVKSGVWYLFLAVFVVYVLRFVSFFLIW